MKKGLAALLVSLTMAFQVPGQKHQVVLLYDERTSLPGLATLDAALTEELEADSRGEIEIYREMMDLSRFGDESYPLLLRDYLRAKYAGKDIDVVVAILGPSLDFLLTNGDQVFPGAQIVFCGIDRRELGTRRLPSNVRGVLLKREFAPSLDVVLRVHPATERIVFVAGTSEFDRRLVEQAKEEFRPYESRLDITYLTDLPLARLLQELSQLGPRTIVMVSTLFRDGAGEPFVPHEVVERISAEANVPVYGFVDQYLGQGIVGGHLYSLDLHGREAAKLVRQVLSGRGPVGPAFVDVGRSKLFFDARQLDRWDISEGRLPPGSVVLFRDPSLWNQYRGYVLAGLTILALQTLMITGLLFQRSRRRRAESALRESEIRIRTMADTAPVMIWISGTDGRFTFLNQVWVDFTGSSLKEQLGTVWIERVHPGDLRHCTEVHDRSIEQRERFSVECRLRRHDGTYRWVVCAGVPRFSLAREFLGHICSCMDITERREAELQIQRQSAELAHVARVATIGAFSTSVAHELKQPLGAILLNAAAAERYLDFDPPKLSEIREILADIRQADQTASEMLGRMRGLLQKKEFITEAIDINPLIDEVLHLARAQAAERRVALRFEPAEGLPPVSGDRIHLQQVLMNLVLNGFEAMTNTPEDERELVVRTANGDGMTVRITVTDSGSGIPPSDLTRVFEPFFTTKEKGIGMGLAITRTIVETHGGRIWAQDNPDAGASFYVSLPLFTPESG